MPPARLPLVLSPASRNPPTRCSSIPVGLSDLESLEEPMTAGAPPSMHNERRILLNTTVLSAFEGLGQLANLALIASFARAFGAGVMGNYSVGMSVGAVAAVFVSLGIQGLLVRDISRDPACARDRIGVLL